MTNTLACYENDICALRIYNVVRNRSSLGSELLMLSDRLQRKLAQCCKTFFFVIDLTEKYTSVSVLSKHFGVSLVIASKEGLKPSRCLAT